MKKLLIILSCVAATVGLCAQDTFEDRDLGTFTDNAKTESVWFVSDSTEAEIVQDETTSDKYLQITDSPSDDPLYRAYETSLDTASGNYNPVSVSVPAGGIYFDADVQLTVSDTLDQAAVDGYAKIAFFAYCDDEAATPVTNIVVRAGYYTDGSNTTPTNYFFALPDGVTLSPEAWHRVTIKTIPLNATGDKFGFIAYLDEQLLSYGTDVTCGTADAFVNSLTATARKYYDSEDYGHSLIPGIMATANLTRVLFAGTGALDDVDWTTTAPDFAKDATIITLKWDEGVESITFNGETVNVSEGTTKDFTVASDVTKVQITSTLKDGYAYVDWTDGEKATTDPVTYNLTTYAYQVTVGGAPYKNIDDAVAAAIAADKPLVLANTLTEMIAIESEGNTLVIDLNGNDITVTDQDAPIWLTTGNLVITNSSTTVGTVCACTTENYGDLSVRCEAGEGDGLITIYENCKFEGLVEGNTVTCYGGIFKDVTGDKEFIYTPADGYEATLANGYWTVAKATTKTPLEIFLADIAAATDGATVTLTDNITLTDRIDVALSGKTVTIDLGGKTVTPTATCGNGSAFNIVSGTITIQNGTIDGTAITSIECDPITVRSGASVTLVDGLTISICSKNGACVYPFDGGKVEITGGIYENSTTEAYDARKNTGIVGLAVNQANVATQLITITGGKFKQYDPAKGDDSELCTTFLADGYESVKGDDDFYTVQKKTTPTTWEDVDPGTQTLEDVVADDQLEVIKAANITVDELKTWATTHKVETAPGVDIDLEALTLNCAPGTENVAAAKEDFKATQDALDAIIEADTTGTEEDLENAVKALYKDTYPNATVTVEKITADNTTGALYSTDTLKLFRLKITLGRSE